ncbi:MAG: hypothetical protein ACI4KR_09405 [Ruminiclostridium sp.]
MGNKKENNTGLPLNILFIGSDSEQCSILAACAHKNVKTQYCPMETDKIAKSLTRFCPRAIYIVFRKGERSSLKNFSDVFGYSVGYNARLCVIGSEAQYNAVLKMAGDVPLVHLDEKKLRQDISLVRKEHEERFRQIRERVSSSAEQKPLHILVLAADERLLALCEDSIPRYSVTSHRSCLLTLADLRINALVYLRKRMVFPDIIVISDCPDISLTEKAVNSIYSGEEFAKIPYILLDSGYAGKIDRDRIIRKPALIADVNKDYFTLGRRIFKTAENS